jgi:TIR domain-containing protein
MDIDTIPLGVDFTRVIAEAVGSCDVLIAVIGREWVTITDSSGQRRLDNPEDYVRLEIKAALERDIRVIPAFVQSAQMPPSDQLPDDLALLARRNGISLRGDSWRAGVERLIEAVEQVGREKSEQEPERNRESPSQSTVSRRPGTARATKQKTGKPPSIADKADEIASNLSAAAILSPGGQKAYFQSLIGRLALDIPPPYANQLPDAFGDSPSANAKSLVSWALSQGKVPQRPRVTAIGVLIANFMQDVMVLSRWELMQLIESYKLLPKNFVPHYLQRS